MSNTLYDPIRLSQFLLELGKGFLFEARQRRFTYDEDSYWVDLVFYNRLLQCYILIDLKTGKLKHQDLGQMQMYVNYFDRYIKKDFEKPTVGILLCKEKNDSVVELTFPIFTHHPNIVCICPIRHSCSANSPSGSRSLRRRTEAM